MAISPPPPLPQYSIQRKTTGLRISYYVKENFHQEFTGSLRRLERQIEEEYIRLVFKRLSHEIEEEYVRLVFKRLSHEIEEEYVRLVFKRLSHEIEEEYIS